VVVVVAVMRGALAAIRGKVLKADSHADAFVASSLRKGLRAIDARAAISRTSVSVRAR